MKSNPTTLTACGTARRHQTGVSLIESLVALLVLALGVLGLAGIQARTLVDSRSTNARGAAVRMAEDLNERIQFNTPARLAAASPYLINWGAPPAAPVDCAAAACTSADMAAYDLNQWKTTLRAVLPQGDATVFQSPTDPAQIGVLIAWTDNISDAANDVNDAGQYNLPFVINTGAGVICPPNMICHFVYIRP